MKKTQITYSIFNILKGTAKTMLCKLIELSLYKVKKGKREDDERRKLLIVRIDAIGDFIIFSPMLKYYRMLYPDYHISLLVNVLVLDLAQRFDEINELIGFDRKKFNRNLIYRMILLKKIKEEAFDIVIYPTYSREPNGDYIVKYSKAEEKIGFSGDTCNITPEVKSRNDKYYKKLIPATQGLFIEIERNREFVEALGAKTNDITPSFTPSKHDEKEGDKILLECGLKQPRPFVVICPGASLKGRIWLLERYAKVVTWLKKERGVEVVICGSSSDGHLAITIENIANLPVIDITGKTTLSTLAAVLKKSLLYIGSETGILHLASAVSTPTICIMGGGHFRRFFPYGDSSKNRIVYKQMNCFNCNWKCIYPIRKGKPLPCIERITVHEVLKVVTQLI